MKILTNAKFDQIGGISQVLSSFTRYIKEYKKRAKIVGIDLVASSKEVGLQEYPGDYFLLHRIETKIPNIKSAIIAAKTIKNLLKAYEPVVDAYRKAIQQHKPDIILINGTYFLPWCLLHAARESNIPTILHYHGSISKETATWPAKARKLFLGMERDFDSKKITYVFPSKLTKKLVEKEIFKHPVIKSSVLPNPVPLHFFEVSPRASARRVGIVGRWTAVKNIDFLKRFAQYNKRRGNKLSIEVVTNLKRNSSARLALKSLVKFRNPMRGEKMSRFYQSVGVILSPSIFETYGNVPIEALASGTPALVNASMGVAEVFHELGLGDWVIDFSSLRSVYDFAREVSIQEVSESVRAMIKERYSPKILHGRMLDIIKSA